MDSKSIPLMGGIFVDEDTRAPSRILDQTANGMSQNEFPLTKFLCATPCHVLSHK
uniref:Uncharacterized protein n=1 Tax=Triticum urartu TaxID=4572 RepID=A0A8R7K3V1_TRIUA